MPSSRCRWPAAITCCSTPPAYPFACTPTRPPTESIRICSATSIAGSWNTSTPTSEARCEKGSGTVGRSAGDEANAPRPARLFLLPLDGLLDSVRDAGVASFDGRLWIIRVGFGQRHAGAQGQRDIELAELDGDNVRICHRPSRRLARQPRQLVASQLLCQGGQLFLRQLPLLFHFGLLVHHARERPAARRLDRPQTACESGKAPLHVADLKCVSEFPVLKVIGRLVFSRRPRGEHHQ